MCFKQINILRFSITYSHEKNRPRQTNLRLCRELCCIVAYTKIVWKFQEQSSQFHEASNTLLPFFEIWCRFGTDIKFQTFFWKLQILYFFSLEANQIFFAKVSNFIGTSLKIVFVSKKSKTTAPILFSDVGSFSSFGFRILNFKLIGTIVSPIKVIKIWTNQADNTLR